jgi:hypothetical protein
LRGVFARPLPNSDAQHDVDFEYLVVVLLFELDLDVFRVHAHVFRNHRDQFLLQRRQEVGRRVRSALARDDELQAFLRDRGGFLLLAEDQGKQGHAYFPPNRRLSRPGFS